MARFCLFTWMPIIIFISFYYSLCLIKRSKQNVSHRKSSLELVIWLQLIVVRENNVLEK